MSNLRERWIKAYNDTLTKYENDTHQNSLTSCKKCKIVKMNYVTREGCVNCPESVHNSLHPVVACTDRHTAAMDSDDLTPEEKVNIISYHKQAVDFLNEMKTFNMESFKTKLKEIDETFIS